MSGERGGVSPLVLLRVNRECDAHIVVRGEGNHPAHAGRSPSPTF